MSYCVKSAPDTIAIGCVHTVSVEMAVNGRVTRKEKKKKTFIAGQGTYWEGLIFTAVTNQ